VPASVGQKFTEILEAAGVSPFDAPVLAHRENAARRAVGLSSIDRSGQKSFAVRLASNVAAYNATERHWRTKVSAIDAVTGQLFEYLNLIGEDESFHQALVRHELELSDYRGAVVDLIAEISPREDDAADPGAWLARVKTSFEARLGAGRGGLLRPPPH
jgi:hypothetical protein